MEPLSAFKPPPIDERTVPVFKAVLGALNDIDRKYYPPVETFHERCDLIIDEYKLIGQRFAADAAACGLADWLRYTVTSRTFTVSVCGCDHINIEAARTLFSELERLGHPDVSPLISVRMIWASALLNANEREEAQQVGKMLVADINAYRKQNLPPLMPDFDNTLQEFCRELGI